MFNITNESKHANANIDRYAPKQQAPKTFLYEFSQDGMTFKVDDLDIILCNRLMKNKEENKFIYLFEAYQKLENHLWAKRKQNE